MASAVQGSDRLVVPAAKDLFIVGHPLKYEAFPLKYGALTLYLVSLQAPLQVPIGSSLGSFRANALYYPNL